jgi:UPF0755 protein
MNDRKTRRARRRSRNGFVEILNAVLTLIVLGLLLIGGVVFYGAHSFYSAGSVPPDRTFVVERGAGLGSVAEALESQGLISNRFVFQLGGMALKKQGQLKAGEFRLAENASMADILRELTEGKPVLYGVTIPEGYTAWQVVDRLNADTRLTGEITMMPAEGTILPDTYNYDPGATRQSILDAMQAASKKAVAEIWANRVADLPLTTPEEMVTLASIVEKETGVATERPQVAAVFVNRLKKKMRLQSDPTIIYGITRGQGTLGRGLKRSEIEAKTPYNTYQIDALPPGPIANPGLEALKAVANPAKTKDLYFVAAGPVPSDGHLFAETYAQHRQNVAKWRQIEAAAAKAAEAEADAAKDAIEAEQAQESGEEVPTPPASQ